MTGHSITLAYHTVDCKPMTGKINLENIENKRPKGLNGHLSTIIKDPLFDY
jgi:hypothetical protein